MNKIVEDIKAGCRDCPKITCMWGGFVGDCPYNTYKSEPTKLQTEYLFEKMQNEIDRLTTEIKAKDKEITRLEGKYYRE